MIPPGRAIRCLTQTQGLCQGGKCARLRISEPVGCGGPEAVLPAAEVCIEAGSRLVEQSGRYAESRSRGPNGNYHLDKTGSEVYVGRSKERHAMADELNNVIFQDKTALADAALPLFRSGG